MYCPNFNDMCYRKDDKRGWITARVRCKSWQCEFCVPKNRQMWRAFLGKKLAKMDVIWWFGTITAPAWHRTPETSLKAIRTNMDRFIKRLKRVFKSGVEYVRIYEKHKTGAFHLHIIISGLSERVERYKARSGQMAFRVLLRTGLDRSWHIQTWWKKTLAKCGCGYIAEIKIIPTFQAVRYITKYMTKAAQDFNVKHLRRIQTTRGIGSPKNSSGEKWRVDNRIWGANINYQAFVDLDTGERIPADYWKDFEAYPHI